MSCRVNKQIRQESCAWVFFCRHTAIDGLHSNRRIAQQDTIMELFAEKTMMKCYGSVGIGHGEYEYRQVDCSSKDVKEKFVRKMQQMMDVPLCNSNGCVIVGRDGATSDGRVWWNDSK